jgi:RNA recognition motif-containing protein
MANDLMDNPDAPAFFNLCRGFVGNEASISFTNYVKNINKQITATDILDNFPKYKKKIEDLGQEKWNICIDKIKEHVAKHGLHESQAENLSKFSDILPDELIIVLWGALSTPGMEKMDQVRVAHKALVKHILRIFRDNPDAMKTGGAK